MNKVIDELAVVHRKNMDQIKVMEIPRTLRYIVSFNIYNQKNCFFNF